MRTYINSLVQLADQSAAGVAEFLNPLVEHRDSPIVM